MSVKCYLSIISLDDFQKHVCTHHRLRQLTQRESQKITYLLQVIQALSTTPLCVTSIIKKTGHSPKSVEGSLEILEDKGVIVRKREGHKIICELNRENAKRYSLNLLAYLLRKKNPETWPIIKQIFKDKKWKKKRKDILISYIQDNIKDKESFWKFLFSDEFVRLSLLDTKQELLCSDFKIPSESLEINGMSSDIKLSQLVPSLLPPDFQKRLMEYEVEYDELREKKLLRKVKYWNYRDVLKGLRERKICLECLENNRNWKNVITDHQSGEIICKECCYVITRNKIGQNKSILKVYGRVDSGRQVNPTRCQSCKKPLKSIKKWSVQSPKSNKGFIVNLYECSECGLKKRIYTKIN